MVSQSPGVDDPPPPQRAQALPLLTVHVGDGFASLKWKVGVMDGE